MKQATKAVTIFILLFTTILAGCSSNSGGNAGSSSTPDSGKNQSPAPSESTKEEPVTIQVAYYADETARETFGKIIDKFMEKNEHITVEDLGTDWGTHYTNLKVDLASGDGPTVFLLDGPYIAQYAEEGAIENLTDRLKEISLQDYYGFDAIKNAKGEYFAVPQAIQVNVLYYNKDMFDEANVAYPTADWTTDDVYAAAQKLTDKDKKQYGIGLANHFRYGWYTTIRQFGGDLLDETRTKSTFASDPKVKEALIYMKKFWDEGLTPSLLEQEGEVTPNHGTWFPRGITAMFYDNFARRLSNDQEGINYDVALMPKGVGGVNYSALVANSWVLDAKANDTEKEAGWKFIQYFLSDEAQELNASLAEGITANKAMADAALSKHQGNPANIKVFLDSMEHASNVGDNPLWEEWIGAIDPLFTEYLAGKLDIEELLKKGDTAAQAVLDKIKK
ncbi:ABC transporter substrate-binding protein [Paenibacillus agaridevorans]|uniref:ABC transporter substrate-binding protein n=1 Tax=Paenibacillus agaridevorans TaxID=171404 RepID=A0A2R5EGX7_9BACL|nr:sugar ABC transporter substrate-binding protein [Paenibacillus agaridevorans]GBG05820.1 ABC transporter substrate-binding protein [Paenibacillus agaridevorans]